MTKNKSNYGNLVEKNEFGKCWVPHCVTVTVTLLLKYHICLEMRDNTCPGDAYTVFMFFGWPNTKLGGRGGQDVILCRNVAHMSHS